MHKDFLVLRRDLRYMSQLVLPLIMGIVFAVMLLRAGGEPMAGKSDSPAWVIDLLRSAMPYGSMAISVLVGYCLVSNLTQNSFSLEGKTYWILKTSPIITGKLLVAKFLFAYLPAVVLSWLFLLAIAILQKVPSATIFYGFPCIALILAGLGGINLAIGVRSANLNWTDPRHMSSGVINYLGIPISFAYQIVTLLLFCAPPIGLSLLNFSLGTGQLIGLLAGGMITLLCTILPLSLVKDRVNRIGEE
jgi:ABC-2 type transport system permease protein